eukprot:15435255-Alexandrium_andersonii.AAC.1
MLRQHLCCVPPFLRPQDEDVAGHLCVQGVHLGARDEASRQDQYLRKTSLQTRIIADDSGMSEARSLLSVRGVVHGRAPWAPLQPHPHAHAPARWRQQLD